MPPSPPPAEILDWARRDLMAAVDVVWTRDHPLFSAGEGLVLRALQALPEPAQSLYARLYGRKPQVFFLDELRYAEIPDLPAAAEALIAAGLADPIALAPLPWIIDATPMPGLKAALAALQLPVSGRRDELVARIPPEARPLLSRPGLFLRHRGLMLRVCRLYLQESSGDLSRAVMSRVGVYLPPSYTPTGGEGLFPRRADLLAWEAALARMAQSEAWTAEDLLAEGARALLAVEATPRLPDHRARFSARRYDEAVALAAARHLERLGQIEAADAVYARLLPAGLRERGEAVLRRALCLEGLGRAAEAAALCDQARDAVDPVSARGLERTGRRLARAAGQDWRPLPPLRAAPERQLALPSAERQGARPGWGTRAGATTIEGALADRLDSLGRQALHGENELWTSLFGLLFREVLFAPVPGMLPTPWLSAPLDLGSPGFADRRRPQVEAVIAAILAGEAPDRLRQSPVGEAILGVRWDRFDAETLARVAEGVGPLALATVLRLFAEDWRGAVGGLPDLCVLPGPELHLPQALPARLPPGLLFVEVKGPTDALRDRQRVWLDRLLAAGLPAEVWHIVPSSPATAAG